MLGDGWDTWLLGPLFIMVLICGKPSTVFVFLSLCFLCHPQFRAGGDVGIILYRRSLSVRTCTQEFAWSQMYRLTASTQKHRSIHAYTDTDRQTHTHTHTRTHVMTGILHSVTYAHTHTHTHTHTHHTHTCTYAHTHTHTHGHTDTDTERNACTHAKFGEIIVI